MPASTSSKIERRHAIEARENRLEREHDARQLAAGRDARERPLLVSDVERDAELDRFRTLRPDLAQRHERGVEATVGHAEIGQHFVHGARQSLGACRAKRRERGRALVQRGARRALALLERAKVEPGRVDEIELLSRGSARRDDVGERGAVLLREPEEQIAPPTHFLEALGIELDGRLVLARARARAPRDRSTPCRTSS